MFTNDELQKLSCRPDRTESSVLTLYLGVASAGYRATFEKMLEKQKASIYDHFEAVRLLDAVQHVEAFLATYRPSAPCLVAIFDRTDGFMWTREFQISMPDLIHWGQRPYLRPLAEALEESPHYGVALLTQNAARLFVVRLGEIEEYRRPNAGAADAIRRMLRSQHLSHLILSGPAEIALQVRNAIAKRFGRLVISEVHLPFTADPAEILEQTSPVAEEVRREEESEIVRDLTVHLPEGSSAVTGLGATLDLLNQGRIWRLVYAEGVGGRALECRQCAAVFGEDHEYCVYCGSPLEPVGNLEDLIYRHSIQRGVRVRKIHEGASSLSLPGGIAGYVRPARTRSRHRRLS